METVKSICENRLYKQFTDADLMCDIKQVELLNMTDDAMEETTIEVVDYMTLFGVEIDRDYNFEKGMHKCRNVGGKEDF